MEDRRNGAVSERVARLRIELQELEPKIWRRIDMPLSTTLEALHEAIQMTMGWTFSHLWEFDIDGRCYGDPSFREFDDEPPVYKAKGLRLGVVIARGVDRFVYTYDYGDNWRHDVIVEEVRDGDPDREYPAFVDGARRCPPEDVGGPHGFMDTAGRLPIRSTCARANRDMVLGTAGRSHAGGCAFEAWTNMVAPMRRGPLARREPIALSVGNDDFGVIRQRHRGESTHCGGDRPWFSLVRRNSDSTADRLFRPTRRGACARFPPAGTTIVFGPE